MCSVLFVLRGENLQRLDAREEVAGVAKAVQLCVERFEVSQCNAYKCTIVQTSASLVLNLSGQI